MSVNQKITEKTYRKLAIQVSLNSFKFCAFDTLNDVVLFVKEVDFSDFPKSNKIEDHFWKAFVEDTDLTKSYDDVVVLHENNLSSFVPSALFDENYLGSYLQYNTKVFETDFFAFDELSGFEMANVYIPYVNINNFLLDQFESFDYKHVNSILVPKLLEISKNVEEKQVFVHVGNGHFEIIVAENQKLLLFNSFDFVTKEDFIYYLLFTAEQLKLNPETFKLQLLGEISEESDLFKIAFKYIRNVSLLGVYQTQKHNDFSTEKNLKHFILFNS